MALTQQLWFKVQGAALLNYCGLGKWMMETLAPILQPLEHGHIVGATQKPTSALDVGRREGAEEHRGNPS
jgi:hypothetical protein